MGLAVIVIYWIYLHVQCICHRSFMMLFTRTSFGVPSMKFGPCTIVNGDHVMLVLSEHCK